jgi:ElaB/YqjD/DUF883 family membrane-anchored ribosome-binding protein
MVNSRSLSETDKIHTSLKKIKETASAKELELVEVVSSIYETVKSAQEKTIETARDAAHSINESVHKNPWNYIGGAVLVGFFAGLLARRS